MHRIAAFVAAAMAALTLTASAFAFANPANKGQAEQAPGQEMAMENCAATVDKQTEKDISAGGGSKEGIPAPTNCDHFFQREGLIGNQ